MKNIEDYINHTLNATLVVIDRKINKLLDNNSREISKYVVLREDINQAINNFKNKRR